MHLIDTPYNPIPHDPKSGLVEVEVGIFLRYALWRNPTSGGKGTVVLLQGRGEYIEKNFETAHDLLERGFDVLSFDWRGQGGSSRVIGNRHAGYVDSFDEYVTDLKSIIHRVALPDCRTPLFLLGHSTGSLVALLAAPEIANKVHRMVLCAPLLGLSNRRFSQASIHLFSGVLSTFGLGELHIAGRTRKTIEETFSHNALTSSPERYERNQRFAIDHPELCIGGPTASWLFAACNAMDHVHDPDFHSMINIPLLVINAGLDRVVNNMRTERLVNNLRTGSTLTVDGARHELWHEDDLYREQFLAAVSAFLPGSGIK